MVHAELPNDDFNYRTIIDKKQLDLLDSFINIGQYEKLLFYLEANLFNSAPRLECPSPFILRILLSLSTMGEYNNADIIRKEFGSVLNEQPIHKRAANILKQLIQIVKAYDLDAITNNEEENDDPFGSQNYDLEDIETTRGNLIRTLDFFKEDRFKILRPRILNKDYKDNKKRKLEEHETNENNETSKVRNPELDWSPQKRALEREFARVAAEQASIEIGDSDEDSDDERLHGTADKNSLKIFDNDRIDVRLGGERVWGIIPWVLSCGSSNDTLHREIFTVWEPVLEIIFDILDIELSQFFTFKQEMEQDDSIPYKDYILFSDTNISKFLLKAGRYNFPRKIAEFIFTKFDTKFDSIAQSNELKISKSIHLTENIRTESKALIVSPESANLRRQLFFLIEKASNELDDFISSFGGSKQDISGDIHDNIKYILNYQTNYEDLINFFRISEDEFKESWKIIALNDLLICHLVQLATYDIGESLDEMSSDWILKSDSLKFIKNIFKNITYDKKYYIDSSTGSLDFGKMKIDFSKLSFILFDILHIWLVASKTKLTESQIKELINLARTGEKKRIKAIKACQERYDEDELQYLTKLLEIWFEK